MTFFMKGSGTFTSNKRAASFHPVGTAIPVGDLTHLILLEPEFGPVLPEVFRVAGHHVRPRELQLGLAGHAGLPGDELGDGHRLPDLLPVPVEDGNLSEVKARGLNMYLY